ncbi:hypothetical protein Ahy_A10g050565 [Arachis hypogaea]|uniref:Urease domain-containing protein n=1 Tax=Arachis hypogaea TaxID=3818 RepID=A0A445B9R1_ARAHY|nr:hypothetical protein Ahy_A10g050565 [Arachis hypogaea]
MVSMTKKNGEDPFPLKDLYGLQKRVEAVENVRRLIKLDMKLNDSLPNIIVDPESDTVTVDEEVLACSPTTTTLLSRK